MFCTEIVACLKAVELSVKRKIIENKLMQHIHISKEPSWLPHAADILYIMGFKVCELFATICTEKSEMTKHNTSNKNATARQTNCNDARVPRCLELNLMYGKAINMKPNIKAK